LRGYFSQYKEEDAGGLSPGKDDDAVLRKIDRKDVYGLDRDSYKHSLLQAARQSKA